MKSRSTKLMQLVFGCVLAATVLFAGSSGMVLCIGDDGHFAVEPSHQGHCDGAADTDDCSHSEAGQAALEQAFNCASGCTDVYFGLNNNMSHIKKDAIHARLLKSSTSNHFAAGSLLLTYNEDHKAQCLDCGATPRLSDHLVAQGTIVLRI